MQSIESDESTWVEILLPSIEKLEVESDQKKGTNEKAQQKSLTPDQVESYRQKIVGDVAATVAQNALSRNSVWELTRSRRVIQNNFSSTFSINIDHGDMPVTNQRDSGRCWLFGTLNLFRFGTRDKLNLPQFEFSESYLYFFHLLEQANSFCENAMEFSDRPIDDRLVQELLDVPYDGGDFGIAVNLVEK